MLTCIARTGEVIVIDDLISFTLIGINDKQVLLGFEHQKKIAIHRRQASSIDSVMLQKKTIESQSVE